MKSLLKVKKLKWNAAKQFKQIVIEWMIDQKKNTNEDANQIFESTQSLKTDSESSDLDSSFEDTVKKKLAERPYLY